MKRNNQDIGLAAEALDETSQKSNRFRSQKHSIAVVVIAIIIALTLTGTYYSGISTNKNSTISSLPGYNTTSWGNNGGIPTLAVMPIISVNADEQLDYLSDGMTEMLICSMSQLPILDVKAPTSVFRYKGKGAALHTVGTDLNVQAVLNGRMVLVGDELELSMELADAQTENLIWSERYHRKQNDLVALHGEIARDVSNKLGLSLSGTDEQRLSKKYTTDPEAYQLYLKGWSCWNERASKDPEKALEYFDKAISLDPNFARAYAGRADIGLLLPFYRQQSLREALLAAREDALKALSLDDELAETHATLGEVFAHEYDFAAAEREYQRAIYLNPNYATAHRRYGLLLFYLARHEEASAELRKASELDPLSFITNLDYAEALFHSRLYDDATSQLNKTFELNTEFATSYQRFVSFHEANVNYTEATRSYAKYREFNGDRPGAELTRETLSKGGWQRWLQALSAKAPLVDLSQHDAILFLTALVEKDGALAELNKFYEVFGYPTKTL